MVKILEIQTKQFGKTNIEEDKIITMPNGMPGFPGMNRFIILESEDIEPFYSYQCVDDVELAFIIINPYIFKPDYNVDISETLKEMKWDGDKEDIFKIYTIVNTSNLAPNMITANLLGPLLINTQRREAVQMVLYNTSYSHKHAILGK